MKQKALIVVTSHDELGDTGKKTGYYLPEVSHPFYALQDSGIHVDIASIKGGVAPMDESSRDTSDPLNQKFLKENSVLIEDTLVLSEVGDQYGAIIFAGGHGTMWDFPNNQAINQISRSIYEKGGVVAAICHGPSAFLGIKLSNESLLISGRKLTGFTNKEEAEVELEEVMPFLLESELVKAGASFIGKENWEENVVVDGRLITGQNPSSAHGVGKAVAHFLSTR